RERRSHGAGTGLLCRRRAAGAARRQRGADSAWLRRALLHRRDVCRGQPALIGPRWRYGVAALPGAAREARSLLFHLVLLLAVRGHGIVRRPDGIVRRRRRGADAGIARRAQEGDRRRRRRRARPLEGTAAGRPADDAREPERARRTDGAPHPLLRAPADTRG